MTIITSFLHQKLKLKHGHLKKIKKKKDNSFLFPPATPINYTKNLQKTPASKNRAKYKAQAKTDKIKKMGSSKIKENHHREKPKKTKKNIDTK